MKSFFRIIAVFAVVCCFASCEETPVVVNQDQEDNRHDRDIFYSVSKIAGMPSISGTTAHVSTEAEWDELLDRFCDMTCNGEQVTFCNANPSNGTKTKAGSSTGPNTITTQNRQELKDWMKEMEKAGKTVNITFDDGTGTWHGVAYTCYNPQTELAEEMTCTGPLVITPVSIMEDANPIYVLALQNSSEEVFILTVHGMMLISETDSPATLIDGYEISLTGLVSSFNDINGDTFLALEIDVNEGDVIIF